jgi:N-acetylglucosaminyldiphosphoundecaprenol N-acetyl-beta-D-mannosaminyltransferase
MRIELFGTPIDALSFEDTVCRARSAMRARSPMVLTPLNVATLVEMRNNPGLRHDVLSSDIISADGMGIVLASRLSGLPLRERVTGIDLMMALLAVCAREGLRPFFLGATDEVVQRAAMEARKKFPGLNLAGIHHGYFGPGGEDDVIAKIRATKADCLFVGMPTPGKERFIHEKRRALNIPFVMGVGGSFDILAGKFRRAPLWMQANGLEWAYRVYQEPRRLAWRYTRTNAVFAYLLFQAFIQSIQRRAAGALSHDKP